MIGRPVLLDIRGYKFSLFRYELSVHRTRYMYEQKIKVNTYMCIVAKIW